MKHSPLAGLGPVPWTHPDGHTEMVLCYGEMPVENLIGYPIGLAARVVSCSRNTLWRAVKLGKLRQNSAGLISRTELERWMLGEEQKREGGKKKNQNQVGGSVAGGDTTADCW